MVAQAACPEQSRKRPLPQRTCSQDRQGKCWTTAVLHVARKCDHGELNAAPVQHLIYWAVVSAEVENRSLILFLFLFFFGITFEILFKYFYKKALLVINVPEGATDWS